MKKRNLTSLKLKKTTVSNFNNLTGGEPVSDTIITIINKSIDDITCLCSLNIPGQCYTLPPTCYSTCSPESCYAC